MDQFELSIAQNTQIDPTVSDNYDLDGATRERAQLLGVPMKLILSDEDVQAKRVNRQKARDALAQQQIAAQGATSFADAAGKRLATGA